MPMQLGGKAWLLSAALLLACVLLVPFAMTSIPPLLDYPDHVAEMYVLTRLPHDPVLSSVYSIHWSVVANSGVELVMPALLRWLPLWPTGDGFLALALLLPLVGAAALSRAMFGCWSPWPLAGGLVAYNTLFLLGFMNFLIGIGAAMLAAAAWIACRCWAPAWTVMAAIPAATALFFIHLFGLLFFGLLIGAHELTVLAGPPGRRWPGLAAIARRLAPDALVFAVPATLLLRSTLAQTAGPTLRLPLKLKLGELFYPFLTYYQVADRAVGLLLLATMGVLLWWRRAQVALPAIIAGAVLLVVWPIVPHVFKDTGYIDARLPTMGGFLLFAGFTPVRLPRAVAAGLFAAIALVTAARVTTVAEVWRGHEQDVAELRRVTARVEPGAQVLAVDVPYAEVAPYWLGNRRNWLNAAYIKTYYHLPALLIPDRHAFWPRLFTGLGKQPVVVNPPFAMFTAPEGELPDYHELASEEPSPAAVAAAPYLAGWQRKFDYVLVVAAGAAGPLAALAPARLQLLEQTEFVALFRVLRTPAAPRADPAVSSSRLPLSAQPL